MPHIIATLQFQNYAPFRTFTFENYAQSMPRRLMEAVHSNDSLYIKEGERPSMCCCVLENNPCGICSPNDKKKVISGNTAALEEQCGFTASMILSKDELIVWGSREGNTKMELKSDSLERPSRSTTLVFQLARPDCQVFKNKEGNFSMEERRALNLVLSQDHAFLPS